jgi:hypothetical protein
VTPQWPQEMEIIFIPGTKKLMLTSQQPLVHLVIQAAFHIVHSSIIFIDAFPDAVHSLQLTNEALIEVAATNLPAAANIHS